MNRWMSTAKLRALAEAGLSYDEIAAANERAEGWRPWRSTVKRKLDSMGLAPRHASHRDLLPWDVAPEHHQSRLRYYLMAESRKRQGMELSDADKVMIGMLYDLLFGRGVPLVVGYDRRIGFYTIDRVESDTDIIRQPISRKDISEEAH